MSTDTNGVPRPVFRNTLNLSQAARAAGMTVAGLQTELSRGVIPGITASLGRPGKAREFDFGQAFLIALYGELRSLTVSTHENGRRALEAARKAEAVLRDLMNGKRDTIGALAVVTRPGQEELRVYFDSEKSLCNLQGFVFQAGGALYTIPLVPVVKRVLAELEKVNGLPEGSLSSRISPPPSDWEPAPAAGASAKGPAITDARSRGGQVQRIKVANQATGAAIGLSGLSMFYKGEGLQMPLTADEWAELARHAEVVAAELRGRPGAPPEATAAAWHLESEVAGNA